MKKKLRLQEVAQPCRPQWMPRNINYIMNLINQVSAKASDLPKILKSLDEARENLMYEKETETARGGTAVSSSMDASQY